MSKVRVGILGTGGFARHHANNYNKLPDAEVVALCDVSQTQLDAFMGACFTEVAEKPVTYTDPAKMYAEANLDAVSICTPHTLHFGHCCQALEAGCHVLVEKPMVTALDQAIALNQKVKETGKILVVGYNTPCTAEISYVRDAVRDGRFGKLKVVSMYISQPWYHFCQGKWRMEPELSGGGMIYDSGAHVLNSLVWTIESDVDTVHAFIDNLDSRVDINGTINVKFTNGVIATVAVSGESPNGSFGSWMFETGLIESNPWGGDFLRVYTRAGQMKYPVVDYPGSTPMGNFIASILGREEPRTSPRNGINQSQLLDAVYESARTGLPVRPADLIARG